MWLSLVFSRSKYFEQKRIKYRESEADITVGRAAEVKVGGTTIAGVQEL